MIKRMATGFGLGVGFALVCVVVFGANWNTQNDEYFNACTAMMAEAELAKGPATKHSQGAVKRMNHWISIMEKFQP